MPEDGVVEFIWRFFGPIQEAKPKEVEETRQMWFVYSMPLQINLNVVSVLVGLAEPLAFVGFRNRAHCRGSIPGVLADAYCLVFRIHLPRIHGYDQGLGHDFFFFWLSRFLYDGRLRSCCFDYFFHHFYRRPRLWFDDSFLQFLNGVRCNVIFLASDFPCSRLSRPLYGSAAVLCRHAPVHRPALSILFPMTTRRLLNNTSINILSRITHLGALAFRTSLPRLPPQSFTLPAFILQRHHLKLNPHRPHTRPCMISMDLKRLKISNHLNGHRGRQIIITATPFGRDLVQQQLLVVKIQYHVMCLAIFFTSNIYK